MKTSFRGDPPDQVVLALYSNDDYGKQQANSSSASEGTPEERAAEAETRRSQPGERTGPDPGVSPYFQRKLVWALIFHNKPYRYAGRAGVIDSDFVTVVDADTGEPLQTIAQPSPEWLEEHAR